MGMVTKERQHAKRDKMRRNRKHWRASKINGRFKAGHFIVSGKRKHITSQHQSAREETKENKKTLKIVMFDSQGTATQ